MVAMPSGYLLDTNVISELMKPRPARGVAEWIEGTPEELLYLSVITIGEIRKRIDLLDENEVVDWRSVCDDNHVESRLKAELLSPGAGGAFRGLARNRQP